MVGAGPEVRAFLITDIRGYSNFTSERGAPAAARLASTFTELGRDAVAARGGKVLGLRGDEILAAFTTADQAVRAALDVQLGCREATAESPDFRSGSVPGWTWARRSRSTTATTEPPSTWPLACAPRPRPDRCW